MSSSRHRSFSPVVPDPPPKMYIAASKRTEVCARRGQGRVVSDRFDAIRLVHRYV